MGMNDHCREVSLLPGVGGSRVAATHVDRRPCRRHVLSPASAAGFTLIEVMVTLVILSVGLVMVLSALDTSVVALDEARFAMVAERTIREKMGEVESLASDGGTLALASAGGRFSSEDGLVGDLVVESVETPGDGGGGKEGRGQLVRVTITLERRVFRTRYSASTLMWAETTDEPEDEEK